MSRDHFFNLPRPNLVSAGFYQILFTIDDEQVALAVEIPKVARKEQALATFAGANHLRGFIRPLPISLHQLRCANDNLANSTLRNLGNSIFCVENSNFDVREGKSNRPSFFSTRTGFATTAICP